MLICKLGGVLNRIVLLAFIDIKLGDGRTRNGMRYEGESPNEELRIILRRPTGTFRQFLDFSFPVKVQVIG